MRITELMKKRNAKYSDRKISLNTRLLISYAVFAVIVLVLLWISQTFLLDDLYSMVKYRELEKCADVLSGNHGTELESTAEALSQKYSTCISIYNIRKGRGTRVVSEHVNTFCFLHNMTTNEMLGQMYAGALDGGGSYLFL